MSTSFVTLWGIHAGATGDAEALFFKENQVALGWAATGDLSSLKADREDFKDVVVQSYPEKKPGAIPGIAGQLFRFMHEMKIGDLVLYSSNFDRKVHFAKVTGNYTHHTDKGTTYPHRRAVKWIKDVPRTHFTQGALYEMGAAMSFFQVKNYAEEFFAALEGKETSLPPLNDPTVKQVAKDIEVTTRDFVLKRLSQELKGLPLEEFVKHLLECMGYQARLARKNEPSVDVIAHKDLLGIEPPIIKVQVKSGDGTITDKDVSALFGKLSTGEYGLFVTLGTYSPQCRTFEQGKANLRLIDGEELVDLIFQHYERFDSRYKGILPLKRVYVPESVDHSEDE
jgi:restriction system protein